MAPELPMLTDRWHLVQRARSTELNRVDEADDDEVLVEVMEESEPVFLGELLCTGNAFGLDPRLCATCVCRRRMFPMSIARATCSSPGCEDGVRSGQRKAKQVQDSLVWLARRVIL